MARLKQAKEEADKEIATFRAQMEAEFQRKLAEVRTQKGKIPVNSFIWKHYEWGNINLFASHLCYLW